MGRYDGRAFTTGDFWRSLVTIILFVGTRAQKTKRTNVKKTWQQPRVYIVFYSSRINRSRPTSSYYVFAVRRDSYLVHGDILNTNNFKPNEKHHGTSSKSNNYSLQNFFFVDCSYTRRQALSVFSCTYSIAINNDNGFHVTRRPYGTYYLHE